jgi:hypothetical protein
MRGVAALMQVIAIGGSAVRSAARRGALRAPRSATDMSDLPPRKNPGPKSRARFLTVTLIVLALIAVIFIGTNINHVKSEDDRPMGEDRPSPTAR